MPSAGTGERDFVKKGDRDRLSCLLCFTIGIVKNPIPLILLNQFCKIYVSFRILVLAVYLSL